MFKFAVLASLVALAVAQYAPHGGYGHGDLSQPTPFNYHYNIEGGDSRATFTQSRAETGDGHGNVQGSYGYTDSQGNQRQVDYVADGHGFRAQVRTNEPGTDNQSPADVVLHADPPRHQQVGYGPGPAHGRGY